MGNKIRKKEEIANELSCSKAVRTSFIELLKKYHLKPKKCFGQNFLIDKNALRDILKAAELKRNDTVIEIGPGLGTITKELAEKAGGVIAIEKDRELAKILLSRSGLTRISTQNNAERNIKILQGDILKFTTNDLQLTTDYKVVANLPYYIVSPVIRKFLESDCPPTLMVLIAQKEVAERICSSSPKMSLLAVAVQLYSKPEIVRIVKKESFWPKPKVDSAILRINPLINTDKKLINTDLFFKIVKAGFSQPRKQLKNNLKKIFGKETEKILKKANIDPSCRAETLSVGNWKRLVKIVENDKMKPKSQNNF